MAGLASKCTKNRFRPGLHRGPRPRWGSLRRSPKPLVGWGETLIIYPHRLIRRLDLGHGLGLAGLVLFCEKQPCNARRHNDLEGRRNFSSTIYSFYILCLEHHYCGDQQWRSLI